MVFHLCKFILYKKDSFITIYNIFFKKFYLFSIVLFNDPPPWGYAEGCSPLVPPLRFKALLFSFEFQLRLVLISYALEGGNEDVFFALKKGSYFSTVEDTLL